MSIRRALVVAGVTGLVVLVSTPSLAATSIYAQAGASGIYAGTYSLGVRYFSPFGLEVLASGPTNGTTSSYTPTSAATGLTAISLAAAVNGKGSGSSTASVDLAAGTVKATAKSDTYQSDGSADAELSDDLKFTVAGGGSKQITVVSHLDGTIGAFANSFSLSGLSYILNFGTTSNIVYSSLGSQSGFTYSAAGASSTTPVGWDSYTLSNVTGTGFDFTGLVTVSDGEERTVMQRLHLNCQEGVDCDFSHTGSIALDLPSGVSFTSASGVFLTPPSPPPVGGVPEPASWAMMLAGFGLVGGAVRLRRVAARATTA